MSAGLRLVLFVLPLGLDTFAVAAGLGLAGLQQRARLRVSLLMSCFEMAMPIVGLVLGRAVGTAIGSAGRWLSVAILFVLGIYLLFAEEGGEEERIARIGRGSVTASIALGVSISLDELAIGFALGLFHVSIWIAIALIGAQAFLLAQLGLRVGTRLGEAVGDYAEKLAGAALVGLGVLLAFVS